MTMDLLQMGNTLKMKNDAKLKVYIKKRYMSSDKMQTKMSKEHETGQNKLFNLNIT